MQHKMQISEHDGKFTHMSISQVLFLTYQPRLELDQIKALPHFMASPFKCFAACAGEPAFVQATVAATAAIFHHA